MKRGNRHTTAKYVDDDGHPMLTWKVDLDGEKDDMADIEVPQSGLQVFLVDRYKGDDQC